MCLDIRCPKSTVRPGAPRSSKSRPPEVYCFGLGNQFSTSEVNLPTPDVNWAAPEGCMQRVNSSFTAVSAL
eukprot:8210974-Alexandrium_andersonii.AAC.1